MKKAIAILLAVLTLAVLVPGAALAAPPEIMQDRSLWTGGDPVLTSWAKDDIDDAVRYEFFLGYPQGTVTFDLCEIYKDVYPEACGHKVTAKILPKFEPYNTITRAEFATILARATGFGDEDYKPGAGATLLANWRDIDKSAWYWRYLDALAGRGVIQPNDRPGVTFEPNGPITRLEIALWSARAARAYELSTPVADLGQFPDADRIAGVYRDDVARAVGLGVIKGRGDGLHPYDTATRAEAAAMLMRLVRQLRKNPPTEAALIRAFDAISDALSIWQRDNPKWKVAVSDLSQLSRWYMEGLNTIWWVPEPLPCTPIKGVMHRAACYEMDETPSQAIGIRVDPMVWYRVGRALRVLEADVTDRTARVKYEILGKAMFADGGQSAQGKDTAVLYLRKEGGRWKYSAPGPFVPGPGGLYDPNLATRVDGKTLADIP